MDKSPDATMSDTVFGKILSDLREYDYSGHIHLFLMGEPLTDPNIFSRIKQTREVFPLNSIRIFTNGDMIESKEYAEDLFRAGLNTIHASHYDSTSDHLYDYDLPGMQHLTLNELRMEFYNRGGHVNVGRIFQKKCCDWVLNKAYVNYEGKVILCCSDYDYEVVFGNVLEESFVDIFNSEAYNKYRDAHEAGNGKSLPLCENCNRIQ